MLIPLIKQLYSPNTALPKDPSFYQSCIKEIEYFSLSPQVYNLLKQQSILNQIPSFFKQHLQQQFNTALYQNIFIRHETFQIMDTFERMKIPVIPLKGVLFAEKYFGHIGARGTSDIDLLIKKSDLNLIAHCVKSLGFTEEESPIPSHFHLSFRKWLPTSSFPLRVEIHWNLLKENTSNLDIGKFWLHSTPYKHYQYIRELSDYHTFYMIILHGWKHNLNSIKYFIDIIQLIYTLNNRIDYFALWKDAKSDKTLKRTRRTLAIVYEQFPQLHTVKKLPIKRIKDRWWEYRGIIDSVSRKTYKQYFNILQFELGDFDSYRHYFGAIHNWLSFYSQSRREDLCKPEVN